MPAEADHEEPWCRGKRKWWDGLPIGVHVDILGEIGICGLIQNLLVPFDEVAILQRSQLDEGVDRDLELLLPSR